MAKRLYHCQGKTLKSLISANDVIAYSVDHQPQKIMILIQQARCHNVAHLFSKFLLSIPLSLPYTLLFMPVIQKIQDSTVHKNLMESPALKLQQYVHILQFQLCLCKSYSAGLTVD